MAVEQDALALDEIGAARVVIGQAFEFKLSADELAARIQGGVALFFEPVGEDQARSVVVGVFENVLPESVFQGHYRLRRQWEAVG